MIFCLGYTAVAFESRCLLAWVFHTVCILTIFMKPFKFTILLVFIFIVESVIGLLSYVYQEQLEGDLKVFFIYIYLFLTTSYLYKQENLLNNFVHPYSLYSDETAAVDQIQIKVRMFQCNVCSVWPMLAQYKCCGADSYRDWAGPGAWQSEARGRGPALLVPDSCCKSPGPGCGARDHPSNIHYTGCRHRYCHQSCQRLCDTIIITDSLTNWACS